MAALGASKRYCYLGLVALLLAAQYWTEPMVSFLLLRGALEEHTRSERHGDGTFFNHFTEAFEQAPSLANEQLDKRASSDAIPRASNQVIGQATTRPSSPINESSDPRAEVAVSLTKCARAPHKALTHAYAHLTQHLKAHEHNPQEDLAQETDRL